MINEFIITQKNDFSNLSFLDDKSFVSDEKNSIEKFYLDYFTSQQPNNPFDFVNIVTNSITPLRLLKKQKLSTSYNEETNLQRIDSQIEERKEITENEILSIIQADDYEEGRISMIEKYMEKDFSKSEIDFIKHIAQKIALENLSNTKIINGILRLITSRSFDQMYPEGQYIGLALLQNKNITLREKGIQVFEYWRSKKGIKILKSLDCDKPWLQSYVNTIIEYLELYGTE